jgi:HD superfamily phosphohydrolase
MQGFKIFNDPVHGFIEVPRGLLLDLIDHPWVQRLRRIRQLGLASLVYPGATHSRFSHALGALHLTRQALDTLRAKGVGITPQEYEGALVAILLHDLGHGPFSHALEEQILEGIHHESLSLALIESLNQQFDGRLQTGLSIFRGLYPRPFLHQLISGQLDMDRMDYLMRDSFFTGVAEGIVGTDRIIKTLQVGVGEHLVVEEKGIYSVEKFLIARRMMYWQVYLHKTSLSGERLIVQVLRRAREAFLAGRLRFCPPSLAYFLERGPIDQIDDEVLRHFTALDDNDLQYAFKQWISAPDGILSDLSRRMLNRQLFKLHFLPEPYISFELPRLRTLAQQRLDLGPNEVGFYVLAGQVTNRAYLLGTDDPIMIVRKSGEEVDLTEAADLSNVATLAQSVSKHYLASPVWE